jgi:hypothetical protein
MREKVREYIELCASADPTGEQQERHQELEVELACERCGIPKFTTEERAHAVAHEGIRWEFCDCPLLGITMSGAISFKIQHACPESDDGYALSGQMVELIQKALESVGVEVVNVSMSLFETWDPSES